VKYNGPPRMNLIAHIREQITAGTYETSKKLACAAKLLKEDLEKERPPDSQGHKEPK